MKGQKAYRVTYERDRDGWWVATVRGVPGCHTQGRSINQARERLREALSLFVPNAENARFVETWKLPAVVLRTVEQQRRRREAAEDEQRRAQVAARSAARKLEKLGFSVRDAAELIGLAHQRVQQLLHS